LFDRGAVALDVRHVGEDVAAVEHPMQGYRQAGDRARREFEVQSPRPDVVVERVGEDGERQLRRAGAAMAPLEAVEMIAQIEPRAQR
jgi:hypothetical protein